MQIVSIHDHMDKLVAHDEGENKPRNGKDNRFGKLPYEREHPGVPRSRGGSHLGSDLSDPIVHVVKKPAEVAQDTAHQHALDPFVDPVGEKFHTTLP